MVWEFSGSLTAFSKQKLFQRLAHISIGFDVGINGAEE